MPNKNNQRTVFKGQNVYVFCLLRFQIENKKSEKANEQETKLHRFFFLIMLIASLESRALFW